MRPPPQEAFKKVERQSAWMKVRFPNTLSWVDEFYSTSLDFWAPMYSFIQISPKPTCRYEDGLKQWIDYSRICFFQALAVGMNQLVKLDVQGYRPEINRKSIQLQTIALNPERWTTS